MAAIAAGWAGRRRCRRGCVAAAVAEPVILGVDGEIRAEQRVLGDQVPEMGLDQIVEPGIGHARSIGRRRAGQDDVLQGLAHASTPGLTSRGRPSGSSGVRAASG
jgi:hypothetical protein